MKIVIQTQSILAEFSAIRYDLEKLDIEIKDILTHITAHWMQYQTEDNVVVYYYSMSMTDILEVYAFEDFFSCLQSFSVDERTLLLHAIKYLVKLFIVDIVPMIEALELSSRQYETARIEWVGQSMILDIVG